MSINVKDDEIQSCEKEKMTFDSKIEELTLGSNEKHKDDNKAYLGNQNAIPQLQSADRILNARNQIESCTTLLNFLADSQWTLTQVNGQRKLGPPPGWTGPPPDPKCEIFVGSIPRNYSEPEIVLIFSTVGQIYELRLMMDFSGTNRGYCFIMYTTEEEAARAVKQLDRYEIYPGKRIGVVASTNNRRLYINQLPQNLDSETIIRRMYEITEEVDSVAVYRNMSGYIMYVLVSYKTHRDAAMGRRRLVPAAASIFENCDVKIEWANPNMTPSNVWEESGICDEHGKVEIKKKMIEQTKSKKSVLQTKHNGTTNLRSLKTNNDRGHKSFDATIQNHSATKFPSENTNIPDHSLYNCTPYNCLSKSLALRKSANFSSRSAWDINGNLRNNVDRPLFPKSLKKSCSQLNQSNAILPSISSYLNRARCCRSSKSSEVQACRTDEARRKLDSVQFFAINLPEASHGVFDQRYITNCPIKCRLHSVGNSGLNALRSNNLYSVDHSGWNSVEELGLRMNEVFNVTNENCNGNCVSYDPRTIYRNQQHIPTGNNIDTSRLTNLQTLSDSNRQFVNCISCANCYRCLGVNGTKQNRTPVPFSDQCNGLTVGPGIRQQASYGLFPQQLLQNGLKPGVMSQQLDNCYAEPSSNQQPCVETWRIPGYRNGSLRNSNYLSNQATDSSQKVQGASYEDRVDHWSRLNPSLPYENLLRAMTYPNGVFVENGQQLEQNAQDGAKSFMRPILKGSNNANIKVNY